MNRELLQQALSALINGKKVRAGDGGTKYQPTLENSAIAALEAELAKPEQESVKPRSDYRDWDYQDLLDNPEQEPIQFLANGVRYKVTHQGYYGCSIVGLPENLNGQWVALVEATDSKHLNSIPPKELAKPEQEPVAYADALDLAKDCNWDTFICKHSSENHEGTRFKIPLYAAPPRKEWVGLTDEDIKGILDCDRGWMVDIKKTEQILKEKNT